MYRKYMKRPIDFILCLCSIIVFSPVFLLIAFLVRLKMGNPVIYKQKRPGRREQLFTLYKFRTMAEHRNETGELLPDELRLTRFGKWLRSTSLDELPELFNILKGDMSFIGPRPLLIRYLPYYHKNERIRSSVRPGITGLAQINGRNALSWEERFAYDIQYVKRLSFFLDIRILIRTVAVVLQKKDILVGKEHVLKDLDIERRGELHGAAETGGNQNSEL